MGLMRTTLQQCHDYIVHARASPKDWPWGPCSTLTSCCRPSSSPELPQALPLSSSDVSPTSFSTVASAGEVSSLRFGRSVAVPGAPSWLPVPADPSRSRLPSLCER